MNRIITLMCLLIITTAFLGCKDRPTAEKNNKGIFGQKDKIGEFDPNAKQEISDGEAKPANPLNPLGALNAYGPAVQKISQMPVEKALQLFRAEEGRYPRDYDEFVERIVKPNNIQLPKLPGGKKYKYDVENHTLVVVKSSE